MRKKYQIFLSSTFEDLQEERMCCVNAILDAGGIPAGMEYFKAGRPQREIICKWMDESDLIVLLLGGRYGSIDPTNGRSYTENEYRYAKMKNKPILVIVLEDAYLHRKEAMYAENGKKLSAFERKNKKLYKEFRQEVTKNVECAFVSSLQELGGVVSKTILYNAQEGEIAGGWIKYDPKAIIDVASTDLTALDDEVKKQLFQMLVQDMLASKKPLNDEMRALSARVSSAFNLYKGSLNSYMESFVRSVIVTLRDSFIEVENYCNITYIGTRKSFRINPWLHKGIESDSYQIINMRYNNKTLDNAIVKKSEGKPTANPFYVSDVISAEILFDENLDHHKVQYKAAYRVDYDRFFHEYVFKEYCSSFHMDVTLYDKRQDKANQEYELKWSMFTPYPEQDHTSKDMLIYTSDRVVFNTSNLMLPGNGYIITLNSAEQGKIGMY